MYLALISDTHFGIKSDSKLFYDYQKKVMDNLILPELDRRKDRITKIVQFGDLTDKRSSINFNTLQFMKNEFFEKIKNFKIDLILGNHDCYFKNTNSLNSPSLLLKNDYPNLTVYESATEVDGLLYVPWITAENSEDTLKLIKKSRSKILFGHLEIEGYTMFKGAVCDHGLNSDLFHKFEIVMSGHFHTKSNKGNIHYLGSPWDLIFTDTEDIKGIHFYDTETGELEFVQNPYKIFNKYTYDDTYASDLSEVLLRDETYGNLRNTFVKVYVRNKTNPVFFDRYCERLTEASPAAINYIEEFPDVQQLENVASLSEDTLSIIKKSIDDYSDLIPQAESKLKLENLLSKLYIEALK